MRTRKLGLRVVTAISGMLAIITLAGPAVAVDIIDDPIQIDERAAQIVQTSNSLCWEMHRFHQQQPDFQQSYRLAKQIWSRAGELRDALHAGPVESEVLMQQVTDMNDSFDKLEATLSKWGNGDRSQLANNSGPSQRTVVTGGTEVDLPFIGIRVGRPQVVVVEDGPPQLDRRRVHPNAPGSKRSLERDLAAVKIAVSYLAEDAFVMVPPSPVTPAAASAASDPVPQPPEPAAEVPDDTPQKIPAVTKKPDNPSPPK